MANYSLYIGKAPPFEDCVSEQSQNCSGIEYNIVIQTLSLLNLTLFKDYNIAFNQDYLITIAQLDNPGSLGGIWSAPILAELLMEGVHLSQPTYSTSLALSYKYEYKFFLEVYGLHGWIWLLTLFTVLILATICYYINNKKMKYWACLFDIWDNFFFLGNGLNGVLRPDKYINLIFRFFTIVFVTCFTGTLVINMNFKKSYGGMNSVGALTNKKVYTEFLWMTTCLKNNIIPIVVDENEFMTNTLLYVSKTNYFLYDKEMLFSIVESICNHYIILSDIVSISYGFNFPFFETVENINKFNTALLTTLESYRNQEEIRDLYKIENPPYLKCQNKKNISQLITNQYSIIDYPIAFIVWGSGALVSLSHFLVQKCCMKFRKAKKEFLHSHFKSYNINSIIFYPLKTLQQTWCHHSAFYIHLLKKTIMVRLSKNMAPILEDDVMKAKILKTNRKICKNYFLNKKLYSLITNQFFSLLLPNNLRNLKKSTSNYKKQYYCRFRQQKKLFATVLISIIDDLSLHKFSYVSNHYRNIMISFLKDYYFLQPYHLQEISIQSDSLEKSTDMVRFFLESVDTSISLQKRMFSTFLREAKSSKSVAKGFKLQICLKKNGKKAMINSYNHIAARNQGVFHNKTGEPIFKRPLQLQQQKYLNKKFGGLANTIPPNQKKNLLAKKQKIQQVNKAFIV